MAKKELYDNKIDKSIDWGGDESTGGLAVKGSRVQEFIKGELEGKFGIIYYDEASSMYLVFADAENRDKYLADTTQTSLLLATFKAPFPYTASITLLSGDRNAVQYGTKGNYIDFKFNIVNQGGSSAGDNVICTYTFRRGTVTKTVTEQYTSGKEVHFNIDDYLMEGTNQITIAIQGVTTLASTTVGVIYNVVKMVAKLDTDIEQVYNGEEVTLTPEFYVEGPATKTVEWYVDGELLEQQDSVDIVVDPSVTRTKYITLTDVAEGAHSLQMRAYTLIDDERFYSDTICREFIVYNKVDEVTPIVAIAYKTPAKYGVTKERKLYEMQQLISYDLELAVHNPTANSSNLEVVLDGISQGTIVVKNGYSSTFTLLPMTSGTKDIVLKVDGSAVATIPTDIAESAIGVKENTDELQLDFRAIGRSNASTNKDEWSYGDYRGTFSGFNWNETSGWVNNALHVSNGASFEINLAPLANNPTSKGKTIEIEFASTKVNDDNAVLCDLRNANGAGIVITATSVKMISEAGQTVESSYKDNEFIRFAFVINKATGTTLKGLSFLHINGKDSRSVAWAEDDSYTSDKVLKFVGSEDAEIKIKHIRIYDTALSDDQVFDNYLLYRDSADEMLAVYERNDVYEEGTRRFDPQKMANRIPTMIVTGPIRTLENTTSKDTQITVDIEYTNMQYPTRSFKMVQAAMRPQGTSSMDYPKKNFRIYTEKLDGTIVYDYTGKVVEDKLYSFKEGAQPVNCWCLKADYAESSGTHNTGIARLWNDILFNATIDGEYVFRTEAQKAALANRYPYDVRTTIDGFPILLFYREDKNSEAEFIGKYNFNNDKSTESVFGFEGIPGFDNSRMQCWEVLDNDKPLALFTTADGFDADWNKSFESRYPDTKTPDTTDLKAFCQWMSTVTAEDFATQKWEHFDVYKLAAYYVYLMRFGGADQFVKNAMFTSEDGQHFYYINYDNDTINGLTNDGKLIIPWNAVRESADATGKRYFAGKDSRLWNMLEADEEFKRICQIADQALTIAGLTYSNVIDMFDNKQAGQWCERVYNQDAQYKYVGPYVDKGINRLEMLQGSRSEHRKYWLAKRFSMFDAQFVSGAYKANIIQFKCANNTPAGQTFTLTAGTDLQYGYGFNDVPEEVNVPLVEGQSYNFVTKTAISIGSPVRIYAAPHIQGLDLSQMIDTITELNVTGVYDATLGTKLKTLIVGIDSKENSMINNLDTLVNAKALEHLDVRGLKALTSINLTELPNIKWVDTRNSGVTSIYLAKGSPITNLYVSDKMKSLVLEQLPNLDVVESSISDLGNIKALIVKECPLLANKYEFFMGWFANTPDSEKGKLTLEVDGISWSNVDVQDLIALARQIGSLTLKGSITLKQGATENNLDTLKELFGADVLDGSGELHIKAVGVFMMSDKSEMSCLENATVSLSVEGVLFKKATWSIVSGSSYGKITTASDNKSVVFTPNVFTGATTQRTVIIQAVVETTGQTQTKQRTILVRGAKLAEGFSISGTELVDDNDGAGQSYDYELVVGSEGDFDLVVEGWTLDTNLDTFADIASTTDRGVRLLVKAGTDPGANAEGVLSVTVKQMFNRVEQKSETIKKNVNYDTQAIAYEGNCGTNAHWVLRYSGALEITPEDASVTSANVGSRPWTAHSSKLPVKKMIIGEGITTITSRLTYGNNNISANIKEIVLPKTLTSITSNNTFEAAGITEILLPDGLTEITAQMFHYCQSLKSIVIPPSVKKISQEAFRQCSSLETVTLNDGLTSIGNSTFLNCSSLKEIVVPESVTTISYYAFQYCSSLKSAKLPSKLTTINNYLFDSCSLLEAIDIPSSVTSIATGAFSGCSSLTNVVIPDSVTKIDNNVFYNCSSLQTITLPNALTSIGNSVFYNCKVLDNVVIPETVTSIGSASVSGLFEGCTSLTKVTLPSNFATIVQRMFYGCTSLRLINISNVVTKIEKDAFNGSSIEYIALPNVLTSIGEGAFRNTLNLTEITIPPFVTIEKNAFAGCSNLSKIKLTQYSGAIIADGAFGSSASDYTGITTRGSNQLFVPNGYGVLSYNGWETLLNGEKCGFTAVTDSGFTAEVESLLGSTASKMTVNISGANGTALPNATANLTCGSIKLVAMNGSPVLVPIQQEVTVAFNNIDGYIRPASQLIGVVGDVTIEGSYVLIPEGLIIIDQSISDPATMISGEVNNAEIQAIRNGSHRYLGKYTAEGQMTLCQLDDTGSTKYADGTTADLTGAEGDVFMKMPTFYYKSTNFGDDAWGFQFKCVEDSPGEGWNKWDGNALIGVYEARQQGTYIYSRSDSPSAANVSQQNFKIYARNRGVGYQLVDWQMHCVMALLYYCQYGHTDCQDKIGIGTGLCTKLPGQTNVDGMRDTKGSNPVAGLNDAGTDGNSKSINFWGLENWWGNKEEYIDNVVVDNYNWKITEPDGAVREPGKAATRNSYITKLMFGEGCDMIPTAASGSNSTGFCDDYTGSSSSACAVLRSGSYSFVDGGVAYVDAHYGSTYTGTFSGSRLAFRGTCIIESDSTTFKAIEITN